MKPTKKTRRTDHAERLIAAPLVDVFSAFTSEAKLARWLPPEGATGTFEHVDLRAGGGFLMRLTFDDADVWDPVGLHETIHCTTEERTHLQALIGLGLTDSIRLFPQPEKNYSWWDYRDFAFRRNRGMRIDHILISEALKARATACEVDKLPRKNERPSDHAPVVLTLD